MENKPMEKILCVDDEPSDFGSCVWTPSNIVSPAV
jgi:hypothetical protein